jgi:parallel beta-helix repeat protein
MNRFPPNRMAIAALAALVILVCAERAQATDISGTITSTLTISDHSQLVGDVNCNVPLTAADANGVAPCIAFGSDHIKLKLNGHTISGPVVPPTGCSLLTDPNFGVGIFVNGNRDVEVEGPGVIQYFERWGLLLQSASHVTIRKVTANRNCWSGMQTFSTSDSNFEEDIWINNAAGSNGAPCGGICLVNSNQNKIHKCTFYGNGSVDTSRGNLDFGVGFEGSSSQNRAEENDIGGNTNGVFFFNSSSDNVVRRNIIAGNPPAQVIKTFTAANQQGADIAFRPNFTGTNNEIKDNFCLTYIQGAGPATAPCPNMRTEGAEEADSLLTSPLNGEKGSNRPRMAPSGFQMASAIASFLAVALGLGLLYTRVTV